MSFCGPLKVLIRLVMTGDYLGVGLFSRLHGHGLVFSMTVSDAAVFAHIGHDMEDTPLSNGTPTPLKQGM